MSGGYRYGFQNQEKDDEIKGEGISYTAEYWEYDSRLGRRWNLDPHTRQSYFTTELEKEVEAFQYEHIFLFLCGS